MSSRKVAFDLACKGNQHWFKSFGIQYSDKSGSGTGFSDIWGIGYGYQFIGSYDYREGLRINDLKITQFNPKVVMIPIAERHVPYADGVAAQLRAAGVRVEVDARNEKMNAKIREHAMQKVPFLLVVGDKESEANKVNVRTRGKEKTEDMGTAEFVEKIKGLIKEKSTGV